MTKETFVFFSGILVILIPFFGIPETWKTIAIVIVGALLIFVGYAQRRARYLATIDRGNGERGNNSFVETTQPLFDERTP